MSQILRTRFPGILSVLLSAGCMLIELPARAAQADELLGLYLGGAIGQADVLARGLPNPLTAGTPIGDFGENHGAYQAMIGIRPVSLVGVELGYLNFGHPSKAVGVIPSQLAGVPGDRVAAGVTMKGEAAFGVLYLPIPIIEAYAKAGLARLQTTAQSTARLNGPYFCTVEHPACQFSADYGTTNTGLAAGVGAQYKIRSWAVRAEFERFSAAGEHPRLLSLGLIWTFP